MKFARFGYRVSDISHAVQKYVEENGFSVVRDYVGHGVGANLHESPEVPNYGKPGHGPRLAPGMTLAVEPMVNQGDWRVKVMKDGWTVRTAPTAPWPPTMRTQSSLRRVSLKSSPKWGICAYDVSARRRGTVRCRP